MSTEDWRDQTSKETFHPLPGRSRVEVKDQRHGDGTVFRAFTDEAAQAALELAAHSQERLQFQQAIISALVVFNVTACGAVLAFVQSKNGVSNIDTVDYGALILGLFVLTVVNLLVALQSSAAIVYYFQAGNTAALLARKHFRLSQVHWDADDVYQRVLRGKKHLIDRHASFVLAGVACVLPFATIGYLLVAN